MARILLGSAIGQGAVLAVSPILTRIYSPGDFGAFALVTAISAVASSVVTLSWERAMVVPRDDDVARALAMLGVISTVVLGSALAIVAYWGRRLWADLFNSAVLIDFWWLIPATVVAIGLQAQLSSWWVRAQAFGPIASRNAIMGLAQATSSLIMGLAGVIPAGLLTSMLVGRSAGILAMWRPRRRGTDRVHPSELVSAARRYRRFPLVTTWSRVINSLGLQAPLILLIAVYGSVEAGLFALTLRVIASPIGIVVDAVSQVFEGSFGERARSGSDGLAALVRAFAMRMLAVGSLPTLIVLVFGPWLYSFVFGGRWEAAGAFAQVVVVGYLAQFAVVPISRTLTILERQGTQFAWDTARAILTLGSVIVCSLAGLGMVWALAAMTLTQVGCYLWMYLLCVSAARRVDSAGRPVNG